MVLDREEHSIRVLDLVEPRIEQRVPRHDLSATHAMLRVVTIADPSDVVEGGTQHRPSEVGPGRRIGDVPCQQRGSVEMAHVVMREAFPIRELRDVDAALARVVHGLPEQAICFALSTHVCLSR
jgi:hypothetical protein